METDGIFEASRQKWSEFAAVFTKQHLNIPDENLVRLFSGRYIPVPQPPARVMDHGFGSANTLVYLAAMGYKCSGCEISEELVKQGAERMSAAGVRADLRLLEEFRLPFDNESQDVIVSWNAIHYNGKKSTVKRIVDEFYRILSPGGVLLLSTVHPSSSIAKRMTLADPAESSYFIASPSPYDNRQGLTFFMTDEPEWKHLLSAFKSVSFGSTHFNLFLEDKVHWGFLVYARK